MQKSFSVLQIFCFTIVFLISANGYSQDLHSFFDGRRFILIGYSHAGMEFKNASTLVFYAEMTGNCPVVVARYRWISNKIIYAVENGRICDQCPPRTWLFQIEELNATTAIIRTYNNTWPSYEDDIETYSFNQ